MQRSNSRFIPAIVCGILIATLPDEGHAQLRVILEGITDIEFWATDDASRLLARNDGRPELDGQLHLWSAIQIQPSLFVYALGAAQSTVGLDGDRPGTEFELTQLTLRYTLSPALKTEAGMIESPLGTFSSRRLPNRNPLIGTPDAYPAYYPWGVRAGGSWGRLDYRAGFVSLPAVNERYVPAPDHHIRPVFGAGFTVSPALRIGASGTWGPYLGNSVIEALPPDASRSDYRQWAIVFDAKFSTGHMATFAELSFSGYDVPTQEASQDGYAYFIETTYTVHPRLFFSARFEQNNYPFIRAVDPTNWISTTTNFYNGEAGFGFRMDRRTLLKVSYRRDEWPHEPGRQFVLENGYAVAVQFSHHFDVVSWFHGR